MSEPRVSDKPDESRFEISLDGEVVGVADYVRDGATVTFTHTIVEPAYEGRGLGATLVGAALDSTRAAGLTVVPQCSFVRHYIETHPSYADLVASLRP